MLLTNYSAISDVYGGGGKLFGGTYIICLYVGMLFGKYYSYIVSKLSDKRTVALGVISLFITFLLWKLLCKKGFVFLVGDIFGAGVNPPGLWLILYSSAMVLTIFFIERISRQFCCYLNRWIDFISYIGTKTLDIFLYHKLFLSLIGPHIITSYIILKVVAIYVVMIGGSIIMGKIYKCLEIIIEESYNMTN